MEPEGSSQISNNPGSWNRINRTWNLFIINRTWNRNRHQSINQHSLQMQQKKHEKKNICAFRNISKIISTKKMCSSIKDAN
jgi:hypothetical protein